MQKQLFREDNLKRVASPDKLNDYIRVSNPAMWLLLAAIIALLLGACVWGIFGKLETKVEVAVQADENGAITCYVPAAVIESVSEGMDVEIGEDVFTISRIDR